MHNHKFLKFENKQSAKFPANIAKQPCGFRMTLTKVIWKRFLSFLELYSL